MGTMTLPASAPRYAKPGRLPGGLHYSWVIVGILVVVQVIGSAISQSAGIMVAPLRDPHGAFGWGIGTIGGLMAVYYVVGAVFAPISGWLGERYGARHLMLAGGLLYGSSMLLLGLVRQPWHFLLTFSVLLSLTQSTCMVPLMAAVSGWFRRRLGLAIRHPLSGERAGHRPAGPSGGLPHGPAGLAGYLLEPRGRRWWHPPIADHPLPQSPRRHGPYALRGNRGRPAGGGPESGDRAAAAPGYAAPVCREHAH